MYLEAWMRLESSAFCAQVDAKIVEVALFFQRELESARSPGDGEAGGDAARPAITVLLLSADNAQVGDRTLHRQLGPPKPCDVPAQH